VIVTGAASGIGAATVRELARRGARILAVDIELPEDRFADVASGEVVTHEADVSDSDTVQGMIAKAVERFGGLGAIFNNAGIFGARVYVTEYPDDVFERVFAVNVRGVFLGMKHAIPALRAGGGGAILNTASTGALIGAPGASAYVAAKHAVLGLTRSAALELASEGIAVNALCPGPTDTPMIAGFVEEARRDPNPQDRIEAAGAIGRLGRPEEIGQVAAWLLLEAPEYLTGVPVTVDGGLTAV
jgi:NAD(P)-dependent dehydrogenase (short-subunit alcohol dehydrogenase family)